MVRSTVRGAWSYSVSAGYTEGHKNRVLGRPEREAGWEPYRAGSPNTVVLGASFALLCSDLGRCHLEPSDSLFLCYSQEAGSC